jgi:hypothetical protein
MPALGGYTPQTVLSVPKKQADFACTLTARTGRASRLRKAPGESIEHVLLKVRARAIDPCFERATLREISMHSSVRMLAPQALVWALYLPLYPTAVCEDDPLQRLGVDSSSLPYHPDVLAMGSDRSAISPLWWAECGSVSLPKLTKLAAAHPSTLFTVAKWAHSDLRGYAGSLCRALPAESIDRFEVRPRASRKFRVRLWIEVRVRLGLWLAHLSTPSPVDLTLYATCLFIR